MKTGTQNRKYLLFDKSVVSLGLIFFNKLNVCVNFLFWDQRVVAQNKYINREV